MVGDLRGEGCTVKAEGIGNRGLSNSTSIVSSAASFIWKRTVQGSTVRSTNMLITIYHLIELYIHIHINFLFEFYNLDSSNE